MSLHSPSRRSGLFGQKSDPSALPVRIEGICPQLGSHANLDLKSVCPSYSHGNFHKQSQFLQHHQQCSRTDQHTADERLDRKLLMQENECQHERNNNAQLINRHHLRCFAYLESFVIAQP